MKELATNPKSIYLLLALYSVYDIKNCETESKCTQHMQLESKSNRHFRFNFPDKLWHLTFLATLSMISGTPTHPSTAIRVVKTTPTMPTISPFLNCDWMHMVIPIELFLRLIPGVVGIVLLYGKLSHTKSMH